MDQIGANQSHWKGVWSCAQYLGSGTGVVGLVLGKLAVKKVILTDYPSEEGLDWQNTDNIAAVVDSLTDLDFLVAADVFYDVCTFRPLIATITAFFDKFPKLRFYFSYEERE
ncbi:hypothetical protein NECAME_15126 [Necator americanus]|uniref:Uncharacterized protein n=1 Tax=Necator americanus TaxID=51031 RepID=W2SJF9_NECAM|nr:hypothetical protein NECAME_15126 [Necator americanus]ETN69740.1 hypothetical protein NECAME_15126 [Necator americanus]